MRTLWDKRYKEGTELERWFYGKSSLGGATRSWFIQQAKEWKSGSTLLDAGSGGGVTAYQLNQAGLLDQIKYVGVDFSECMFNLARSKVQHPNVSWVQSELATLQLPNKFDYILLRAVLEHVEDPTPVLANICKHLQPLGLLYIVFWNNTVPGKPIVEKVQGDFFDIAHSAPQLIKTLTAYDIEIKRKIQIIEPSRRSNCRDIWVCGY